MYNSAKYFVLYACLYKGMYVELWAGWYYT